MKLGDLCNIKQPEIERIIKVPRTRLSDCKRLIFPEGGGASWMDINYDPILHPIYKLPPLEREGYNFSFTVPFNTVYTDYVETKKGMLINDVIKQIDAYTDRKKKESDLIDSYYSKKSYKLVEEN